MRGDFIAAKRKRLNKQQIFPCDKEVPGGMPVFAGTRAPVATLIDYLREAALGARDP
jgi:uncharacterized protein (DUF433 family)